MKHAKRAASYSHRRDLARQARQGDATAAMELLELFVSQAGRDDAGGIVVRRYIEGCMRQLRKGVDVAQAFNFKHARGRQTDQFGRNADLVHFMAQRMAVGDRLRQAAMQAALRKLDGRFITVSNAETIFRKSGVHGQALIVLYRVHPSRIAALSAPWFDGSAFMQEK